MKVHLIGGFTGSGKTTAITNARKVLKGKNLNTAVIKDEQVGYVVDKLPVQKFGIQLAKVTGGCGCCNYNQLDSQISMLKKTSDPAAIFAEYSGTCTNLIPSLLNPLKEYKRKDIELATFSTFVDAQLLLEYLQGADMKLSSEDKYIWEKHLQESEILVVNKIDLLTGDRMELLQTLIRNFVASKKILFQNSMDKDSIHHWIDTISNPEIQQHQAKDSDKTALAWLDEEIEFIAADHSAIEQVYDFMKRLTNDIVHRKLSIDHLQFFLSCKGQSLKIDYTTLLDENSSVPPVPENFNTVDLLVNARVHASPDELRKILYDVLNQFKTLEGVMIKEKFISYYQP
jgi:G3E family GTPase